MLIATNHGSTSATVRSNPGRMCSRPSQRHLGALATVSQRIVSPLTISPIGPLMSTLAAIAIQKMSGQPKKDGLRSASQIRASAAWANTTVAVSIASVLARLASTFSTTIASVIVPATRAGSGPRNARAASTVPRTVRTAPRSDGSR